MARFSRSDLNNRIATLINNNNSGDITPNDVRTVLTDMLDSGLDGAEIIALIDGVLGTGWKTGGGGGGLTEGQARDVAGALLATLDLFAYNAGTDTLSLNANSLTAATARANTEAHRREWANRLGVPDDWSDIANGTAIAIGKVVEHGGAYYGAITAHSKSSTGPDGDEANWVLLSNWRGNWVDAWYPTGAMVRHSGLPYVATSAVVRGNPAPDAAANTKWLALGVAPPAVVIASSNTSIPSTANGNTYVHTGSSNITYTLPAASGGSAVDNGWQVVITNQGAGDLTIDGAGADTIDGSATLVITDNGRSVRVQKIANSGGATIADTKDESGGGGGLNQSQVDARVAALVNDDRILDLAKASRVTGDRGLFLGVSTTDENDLVLRAAGGAATDQTARDAAAAAQATANSKIGRDDLPPFATIYAVPQGIDGRDFPTPFELFFSERITAKTITRLVVNAAGSIAQLDATTPLSNITTPARDSGALRYALTTQSIDNIRNSIGANDTATAIQLTFTFSDGTSYLHTIPFPVNNSVFSPPSPRVQTVTPTATATTINYSNGSAVQLNMNRNVTLNLGGGVHGQSMLVQTVQDGTGSRTLTLNTAIQRDGRTAPTLSTAARARDFLYFYRDATSWVYLGIIKAA